MAIKYDAGPLLKAAGVEVSYQLLLAKGGSVEVVNTGGLFRMLIRYEAGVSVIFLEPNSIKPSEWTVSKLSALRKAFHAAGKGKWHEETSNPKVSVTPTKQSVAKAERVRLEEATELYQPVFGTDPNSKYFVVGIADGLKIAARISSDNVSIKVVGPRIAEVKDRLIALGFSGKEHGHWSVHITCSHTTPNKLIGAILMGLGVDFETGIPNVSVFANVS